MNRELNANQDQIRHRDLKLACKSHQKNQAQVHVINATAVSFISEIHSIDKLFMESD